MRSVSLQCLYLSNERRKRDESSRKGSAGGSAQPYGSKRQAGPVCTRGGLRRTAQYLYFVCKTLVPGRSTRPVQQMSLSYSSPCLMPECDWRHPACTFVVVAGISINQNWLQKATHDLLQQQQHSSSNGLGGARRQQRNEHLVASPVASGRQLNVSRQNRNRSHPVHSVLLVSAAVNGSEWSGGALTPQQCAGQQRLQQPCDDAHSQLDVLIMIAARSSLV